MALIKKIGRKSKNTEDIAQVVLADLGAIVVTRKWVMPLPRLCWQDKHAVATLATVKHNLEPLVHGT